MDHLWSPWRYQYVTKQEATGAAAISPTGCVFCDILAGHDDQKSLGEADDRLVTDQLVAAGRLLDIPVHDHVIIGCGRYVSFAEAGLL